MKSNFKKVVALAMTLVTATGLLAGCGSSGGSSSSVKQSAHGGPYEDEITIDVFDSQANYQGEQTGWFAKIVKDKFNMKLNIIAPNVAGGGDTLYQTRSANGNLGDLIILNLDDNRLKDMVTAGLVLDMTPYVKDCTTLQGDMEAIKAASALSEKDGLYAVPSEISNQPATQPCEATDPTNAASIRWDVYGQIGYPDIKDLDGLLDVMKQMQAAAGNSESGKPCYAFSLFKDWDSDIMQNAGAIAALYGYEPVGFAMVRSNDNSIQSAIDSDGAYVQALKFFYQANQMGLVDPDSTTQNFDNLSAKYKDGQILYSLWPWFGAGQYNTVDRMAKGKGFETATIDNMQCLSYGSYPLGKMQVGLMVGSKTADPQRIVDFIDWLYSSEGVRDACPSSGSSSGPEGLTWKNDNGTPKLTDFGVDAFVNMTDNLQVPDDWGGGTWKDGVSALNVKTVGLLDTDKDGITYNYSRWKDYEDRTATALSKDWSSHNDGAVTSIEYFNKLGLLNVVPGSNYATPGYDTDISTIKEQCKQVIIEDSWKMVFAASDDEFNSLLKDMQDTVNGLGYDQVYAVDEANAKDKLAAYDALR